jgi:hypothetical protein
MNGIKIAALILIVLGGIALAIGSFSYTKQAEQIKLGPIELSVQQKETVNLPVWLGAGVLIAGVLLLLGANRK